MTDDEASPLLAALARPDLPAHLERWRTTVAPGASRPTSAVEWAGAIVLVQRGSLEVDCTAGGTRSFSAGAVLALGWLPLTTLRNAGAVPVELLAIRRRGSRPTGAYLRILRPRADAADAPDA